MVLGTVSVYAYLRFKKIPFAPFADALAPAVVLAQAIGRLGNWLTKSYSVRKHGSVGAEDFQSGG